MSTTVYAGKHRGEPAPEEEIVVETVIDTPVVPEEEASPVPVQVDDALEEAVGRILETKLGHFLADIERRLGQTRELERSIAAGGGQRMVHAEDINSTRHMIDGYTVTANSPGAGSIAWAAVHVVYGGVDYTVADGNTANRYVWFVKPGTYTPGTPVTLQSSNTKPVLANGDAMIFVNNSGTPVSVLESSISPVVAASSVDSTAIIAGAVGTTALADDAVTNAKIGPAAVGTTEVADDAVTNAKIGPAAVGTTELGDDAVTNAKIGPQAVGTTEVANSAIGATQLGAGAVTPVKLNTLQHVLF